MLSLSRRYRPTPPIWLHDEAGGTVVPGRGYGTAGIGSQVRCRCGVCGRNPIRDALQPIPFDPAQLQAACKLVHAAGKKLYLTCNTLPRSYELDALPDFLRSARAAGVDAFIIADMGVLAIAKQAAPEVEVHISTQAGIVNYAAANAFYQMGAKRIVTARELSLDEIKMIRDHTPPELEIEAFVHGAMCMSFSGRCILSDYMVGRDANRGDCAQPLEVPPDGGDPPGSVFPHQSRGERHIYFQFQGFVYDRAYPGTGGCRGGLV